MTTRRAKRTRYVPYSIRFSPEERAQAAEKAARAGLPLSALIRRSIFNTPPPRSARRPTIERQLVAQLLGELGKIGSNLNQLAKHANAGRYQADSIELAVRALLEMRGACMEALCREQERNGKPPAG
jgi:hypothetical protein